MAAAAPGALDFWALAGHFLDFVHRESGLPMIVCNHQGTITLAVDKARIGSQHAGAERILRGEVEEAAVTAEEAADNPLVKEGYSCPIVVGGRCVGTFGITGPLAVARPLARIAAMLLATWIGDLERQRALQQTTRSIFATVEDLRRRTDRAATAAGEQGQAMSTSAARASARLGETDELVGSLRQLARQSRILAINASVEASRLGEQGKAFGVVAREMLSLAEDAGGASAAVQQVLGEIHQAVRAVQEAAERSGAVSTEQVEAMAGIARAVGEVRGAIEVLVDEFGRTTRALLGVRQ